MQLPGDAFSLLLFAGAGPVPPRGLGGPAGLAGRATILSWIGAASEDVGFVLFIVGGIATLIFLIALGMWLLMQPAAGEARSAPSPAPPPTGGQAP